MVIVRGIICTLLTSVLFVSTAAAQRCPPVRVNYIVRSQNGTILTTAELQTLRVQVPEEVRVRIDSSIPSLLFIGDHDPCLMDLQDIVLERDGMRMQLSFNLELIPGNGGLQRARIDGLPFQDGRFVLTRPASMRSDGTWPASSWKSVDELQRTGAAIPAPPRDCVATVQTGNNDLLALRYRAQSTGARSECLKQLVSLIGDPADRVKAEQAARGIQGLAERRLINDKTLLTPLTECVARHLDSLGMFCNSALESLTHHSYGHYFFQRSAAPEFKYESQEHDRVVDDWIALARLLESGSPIFDGKLEELTLRTIREVSAALRGAISKILPDHPVLVNLQRVGNDATLGGESSETVFTFAIGNNGDHRVFFTPGGWPNKGSLGGIRFLILRPGLPNPSSLHTDDFSVARFPAGEADYREQFSKLDLEFRFQILTDNAELRVSTVDAIWNALASLRAANE
jgi:hypothetical protein